MKTIVTRLALVGVIAIAVFAFFYFDAAQYLTLDFLRESRDELVQYTDEHLATSVLAYMLLYIAVTALSLPGAAIMTLAAGALFGLLWGTIAVSFASTIGATIAFLVSRFLLRDWVQHRFREKLGSINKGIEREGMYYLLTLRLIPVFPFFLINLLMGLTPMKAWRFFVVSQIGMLPGTIVYVNAGSELGDLQSLSDVLSPGLLFSFVLLGVFPLLARRLVSLLNANRVLKKYEKPGRYDFNLVVIGAGSGGLVTAYIAAAVKAKVALIEKHKMGGDCLNTGCVPSKALIKSAKVMSYAKRAREFGFRKIDVELDFAEVMERVQRVIKTIEPHDSVERYTSLGVDIIQGEARIVSPYEVEVDGKRVTTRNIVIATGARPAVPSIPGLEETGFYTSDTVWELRQQPKRLLVLGGGPIGCELAQAFARLGSHVTLVQRDVNLVPREDPEVSQTVEKRFRDEGIDVLTGTTPKQFRRDDNRKRVVLSGPGGEHEIEFDEVLIALGRKANVTGFGLEELGVVLSEKGTIEADEFLRTNFPNIYVCGDVVGPFQFTHTASHQAWYAAVNSLFGSIKKFSVDYSVIPWATYTDPEVARVGLNEKEAKARGVEYEVTVYGIDDLDRAIADEEAHGMVKVLTVPGKDKILGVTIVGEHASDLIVEYVAAMKHGFGLNKILGTIHIYPTLAEANKFAAGVWKRNHKPEKLLQWVARFHAWRRGA